MFIDLTKIFDLESRNDIFRMLEWLGCPPKFLSIILSFSEDIKTEFSMMGKPLRPSKSAVESSKHVSFGPILFGIFWLSY